MTALDGRQQLTKAQESVNERRRRRLDAFHPSYRRYIAELTCCANEVEDLAETFPALLFALVSRYATAEKRERAFELICAGEPLRQAADALGLAWWLRRLPAHAFTDPLADLSTRPRILLTHFQPDPARREPGRRLAHARKPRNRGRRSGVCALDRPAARPYQARRRSCSRFMAAWAWFSGRPGLLGNRLLRRPWTPEMSFKRAREELAAWRQRLRLIECLGPGIESPWLADGTAAGFEFVALRTVEDFIAESEALENCLDQYADQLHTGLTAVFSIRKGVRRVACVEIGLHDEEVSMPNIVQLRGIRNRRAPPEVWQATYGWLGGQRLVPLSPLRHAPKPMQRIEARRQLWNPYLQVLEGTRHVGTFRRMVFQQIRTPGLVPQRLRAPAHRGIDGRLTGQRMAVRERI